MIVACKDDALFVSGRNRTIFAMLLLNIVADTLGASMTWFQVIQAYIRYSFLSVV